VLTRYEMRVEVFFSLFRLSAMMDMKQQKEMLEELKKSNALQKRIDKTGQEKAKLDRLARVVAFITAIPIVCYAILRTLAFFMG